MKLRLASIVYRMNGAELRTEFYMGKEYLVCPVISMVGDTVIWPANAPAPEFVPAEVLSALAETRNGRPVVMNHPKVDGEFVSANDPSVMENWSFGLMFNTLYDDNRVKTEAWLDEFRAGEIGSEAEGVISRLKSGEIVEVSEGNLVIVDEIAGVYKGEKYGAEWRLAISDHLAMLPEGAEGACSVDKHGCGALRIAAENSPDRGTIPSNELIAPVKEIPNMKNKKVTITPAVGASGAGTGVGVETRTETGAETGTRNAPSEIPDNNRPGIFRRMMDFMQSTIRGSMSNNTIRYKLSKAVESVEPGFIWPVVDEDLDAKTFIYCTMVQYGDYYSAGKTEYFYWQRSFEVGSDGSVSIGEDRTRVDPETAWVPVGDSENPELQVSENPERSEESRESSEENPNSCSCNKENKEKTMAKRKELVTRLQKGGCPLSVKALEALEEEELVKLADDYTEETAGGTGTGTGAGTAADAGASNPAPGTAPETPVASPAAPGQEPTVTLSKKDYEYLHAAADAHHAQQAARKTALVSQLKTAVLSVYTEAQLEAMSFDELEKLSRIVSVAAGKTPTKASNPDYSLARVATEREDDSIPPAPRLRDALRSRELKSRGVEPKETAN